LDVTDRYKVRTPCLSQGWRAGGWVQREKIGVLDEGMRGEEEREK